MNSFADRVDADRRLYILQLLAGMPDGSANERALTLGLRDLGENISREQTRALITWLLDMRYVTVITLPDHTMSATVNERGGDIAAGRSAVSGVSHPSRI